jgi:hypothetical protein
MNPNVLKMETVPAVFVVTMKYTLDGQDIDDVDADQVSEMVRGVFATEQAAKDYAAKMNKEYKGQEDVHFTVRMHFVQS